MNSVTERSLKIEFPKGTKPRKFDSNDHGLSHCMKAVDYVVELEDRTIFLEIKDPDDLNAKANNREKFLADLKSGLLDDDLKCKCRDSFLYEYASGRAKGRIHYLVLVGASGLSDAELLARTDALKKRIPIDGPNGNAWVKPFVSGCAVLNVESWNRQLSKFPVTRVAS